MRLFVATAVATAVTATAAAAAAAAAALPLLLPLPLPLLPLSVASTNRDCIAGTDHPQVKSPTPKRPGPLFSRYPICASDSPSSVSGPNSAPSSYFSFPSAVQSSHVGPTVSTLSSFSKSLIRSDSTDLTDLPPSPVVTRPDQIDLPTCPPVLLYLITTPYAEAVLICPPQPYVLSRDTIPFNTPPIPNTRLCWHGGSYCPRSTSPEPRRTLSPRLERHMYPTR